MSEYVPGADTVIWPSFIELLSGHLVQTRIDVLGGAAEGAYRVRLKAPPFRRVLDEDLLPQ